MLGPFVQYCTQLLHPSLIPYLYKPMEKGFTALSVLVSRVYEKWVKEKENRQQAVTFADLYFLSTDFIPLISVSFLNRMGAYGKEIDSTLKSVCVWNRF